MQLELQGANTDVMSREELIVHVERMEHLMLRLQYTALDTANFARASLRFALSVIGANNLDNELSLDPLLAFARGGSWDNVRDLFRGGRSRHTAQQFFDGVLESVRITCSKFHTQIALILLLHHSSPRPRPRQPAICSVP